MSADTPVMPAGLSITAQRRFIRELCKARGCGRGWAKSITDGPRGGPYDYHDFKDWPGVSDPGEYTVMIGYCNADLNRACGQKWVTSFEFTLAAKEGAA